MMRIWLLPEKKELKKLESEKEELKKDIKETSKLDQKKADEKSKSLNDRLYDLVKRTENLLGKEWVFGFLILDTSYWNYDCRLVFILTSNF